MILTNSGTAPAEQIELSGTTPPGWKINFDPKTVDRIAPNENKEVKALVTPSDKAVAGDYVTTVRAAARGDGAKACRSTPHGTIEMRPGSAPYRRSRSA